MRASLHLLLLLLSPAASLAFRVVDLVPNGSFESMPDPSTSGSLYSAPNCSSYLPSYLYECDDHISVGIPPWRIINLIDVPYNPGACADGTVCIDLNSQTYTFHVSIGGVTTACGCPADVPYRNITVAFTAGGFVPFAAFPLSHNMSDLQCTFGNYSFDVTADASDVRLYLNSTLTATACGPVVDYVRMFWKPCVDGSLPPVDGPGYTIVCADGWIVTPPSSPAPLDLSGPIRIDGPISVTKLNISLASPMGETLVQVDGVATIDGALSINLGAPVDDGDYLTLINATEIVGEFTSVDVQARGSSCARADIVQDSQSLAALFHTKCKDSRLKGWQIAVIVTGVVLFTVLVATAALLAWKKWREDGHKRLSSARRAMWSA